MDKDTQQFVFRLFAVVLAFAIVSSLLFVFSLAIVQGDGEAQTIVSTFLPWLLGTLGSLVVIFLGTHLGTAITNAIASKLVGAANAAEQPTGSGV